MKYEKLIFIYPFSIGSFLNAKVGLEATLDDNDDVEECFEQLRNEVKAMADKERNGGSQFANHEVDAYDSPRITRITDDELGQYPKPQSEERRIGDLASDIKSCTDIRVLETYRLLVQKKPEFKAIYDEMHSKLSNLKK